MIENRPYVPRDPIEIRIPNSIIFPLQHLEDCLAQVEEGTIFNGERLAQFRASNRFCQRINTLTSIAGSVIGTAMLRSDSDGLKGKLSKAAGLFVLTHATVQAKRAFEKSQRQARLESKDTICKHDL